MKSRERPLDGHTRKNPPSFQRARQSRACVAAAAVRDEEGLIYIAGRVKEMIKTGGENVFPAEIEAVLATHPGIREAAVFGVPDPEWGEAVVAAVVPKAAGSLSEAEIVAWVRSRIAPYKKPRQVIFMDTLPRTAATGRVQKPLLREQFLSTRPAT